MWEFRGIDNCEKDHYKTLYGATTPFLASINSTAANQHAHSKSQTNSDSVLFVLQSIPSSEGHINTLFDDDANWCLTTKHASQSLELIADTIKDISGSTNRLVQCSAHH